VITRAQAEKTRVDAERDVQENGARVTFLYDARQENAATGGLSGPDPVIVKTWALVGGYKGNFGEGVLQGDTRITFAARALDRRLAPSVLAALSGSPTGYWVYLPGNPEKHPEATDPPAPGDRRLAIVQQEAPVYEGGYAVLLVFQCRG
jgi:hypothetical protein